MSEKIYEARCSIPHKSGNPVLQKTGHQSMGDAQMKAIAMSEEHGYAGAAEVVIKRVGETDVEEVGKVHTYINGHEVDATAPDFKEKKDAAVAAATKRYKQNEKQKGTQMDNQANTRPSEKAMAATAAAKAAKASGKKAGKSSASRSLEPKANGAKGATAAKGKKPPKSAAAKPAKKAKTKAPAKPALAVVGEPGSLLAKFGAKEGTFKAKLCKFLVDNKGSMVPLAKAVAATYGSAKPETYSPMQMTINGVRTALVNNDIAWHVERAKDDKGNATIGLKAGAAE